MKRLKVLVACEFAKLLVGLLAKELDRIEGMSTTIQNHNNYTIKKCRMEGDDLVITFQKDGTGQEGPMRELVLRPIAWRKP